MTNAYLEHANLTVSNPDNTAALLCQLFDWQIRWSGEALDAGYTVHVGGQHSYLALYTPPVLEEPQETNHLNVKNLNHLGVVVTDLAAIKKRVINAGYIPFNHRAYEPGERFYFKTQGNVEIEVISYT